MPRPIIAIDIDDVLAASAAGFVAHSNQKWGYNLTPEDYDENWAEVWGLPMNQAVERAEELYKEGIFADYAHFAEAKPVLKRLAKQHDLIVITSRRAVIKGITDGWLTTHFPSTFKDVHYAGIWDDTKAHDALERFARTKAAICRDLGVDYLIDDQPKHCIGAAEAGIPSLLFGDYSWNRGVKKLPTGVTRARTWADIARYFNV